MLFETVCGMANVINPLEVGQTEAYVWHSLGRHIGVCLEHAGRNRPPGIILQYLTPRLLGPGTYP